jgi:hypothetical protein
MISGYKAASEGKVNDRIKRAEDIKIPYIKWESKDLETPQEMKEQIRNLFKAIRTEIKPFTSEILK